MATRKPKIKNKKVKILLPVAGKFNLSFDVGKTYTMEVKQANELIKAQYAEEVK
ncbi:hypothetical protein ACFQ5N_02210 [Lutibacter holmesii]|uniref:Uncharacterized protein n=1 Tax=Lutibacter holmesii TaxID=1137985 RepID=A0ABW3WKG2_9FLAO